MQIHYTDIEKRLFALLTEQDAQIRSNKASDLWNDISLLKCAPICIDNRALFVYHGDVQNVLLVGDWSFWQPNTSLQKIEHTQLFYAIVQFPKDARLQYKLIVDGQWMNDPVNERTQAEGFGYNSEFMMPEYKDVSKLHIDREARRSAVERVMFESTILSSHREMFLFTPNKKRTVEQNLPLEYPLLIVHDGGEALRLGHFHRIIDNLLELDLCSPFAVAFITPQWRNEEYATSQQYIDFTVKEALPFITNQFSKRGLTISSSPSDICVTGASLGGLLATKTVLQYPDSIGNVIAQSPSYWWNRGEIFRMLELENAHKLNVIIQTGTICDAKDLASLMSRRLSMLGARVQYFEYSQGHTWGNWRTTFAEALQAWCPLHHHEQLPS